MVWKNANITARKMMVPAIGCNRMRSMVAVIELSDAER
jgi:hypothetical protein